MTIDEMIAVLQAAKVGKTIQFRDNRDICWNTSERNNLKWDFGSIEYRVKPEPREIWVPMSHKQYIGFFRKEECIKNYPNDEAVLFREVIE